MVSGLTVQFGLGSNKTGEGLAVGDPLFGAPGSADNFAGDSWANMQFGVGYEIANIGLVRVQYLGARSETATWAEGYDPDKVSGMLDFSQLSVGTKKVEAAFSYTGLEGLTAEIGAKIPFPVSDFQGWKMTYSDPIKINLAASYGINAFNVTGTFNLGFLGGVESTEGTTYKYTKGATFATHLIPSYDLAFGTVGVDLGLTIRGESEVEFGSTKTKQEDDGALFGIGAWLRQDLGKGHITYGAGFKFDTEYGKDNYQGTDIYIPIIVEYAF
jgi:hypothetical protein